MSSGFNTMNSGINIGFSTINSGLSEGFSTIGSGLSTVSNTVNSGFDLVGGKLNEGFSTIQNSMNQFGGIMNDSMNTLGSELKSSIADPITGGLLNVMGQIGSLTAQMAKLTSSIMGPKTATPVVKTKTPSLLDQLGANGLLYGGAGVAAVILIKKLQHH